MNRRQLLATVTTSSIVFAGCFTPSGETEPKPTETPTPTETSTPKTQELTSSQETETETPDTTPESGSTKWDPDERYKDVTIGDRDNVDDYYDPHWVNIWNVEEAPRDITVTIESESTVLHDETYPVPGDTNLEIELPEPATYTIEIRVPADNGEKTIVIEEQDYDCNGTSHSTTVYPDGRMEVMQVHSTAKCGPRPEDS